MARPFVPRQSTYWMHAEWDFLEHAILAEDMQAMLAVKDNARARGTLITQF